MYVECSHLYKSYGDFTAADDICFGIEKGSLAALLGPSGSGKTTVLRMIAGLEKSDAGDILIHGTRMNDVSPSRRGIGFVFQNYALFRYMTVYENIAFGLRVLKENRKKTDIRVRELLELTDLTGLEKRYPNELSGGQRQRAAFARALAPNPNLLLLDEPFAAIDAKVRKELRQWLRTMVHRVGITSLFVTHDQEEAVEVADQIIIMNAGRIEQSGTPWEIYKEPKTAFVSGFIGQTTEIHNTQRLRGFENTDFERALLRPEFVEAFKDDNPNFHGMLPFSQKGKVMDVLFRGDSVELKLNVDGVELITRRSLERRPVHVGEWMNIIVYRLYAIQGNNVELVKNRGLKSSSSKEDMEAVIYGEIKRI